MSNEVISNLQSQTPQDSGGADKEAACPFCGSASTEFFSLFGQFLLASQYYCRDCRTVFDVVRWVEED